MHYSAGEARDLNSYNMERALSLASCKPGSGHDCFLKGITVQYDLECSQSMRIQLLRYHFDDIVSSESTMKSILSFDISKKVNKYVDHHTIERVKDYQRLHHETADPKEKHHYFLKALYNTPLGLELVARHTTNYLQLKTIYQQRRYHKLPEWRSYCKWIKSLPNSELITGEE